MKRSCAIKSCILCLAAAVCCTVAFAGAGGRVNPLLEMVGRTPCGEYYEAYEALCDSLFSGDSLARADLVRLFTEAAAADPSGAWELDRRRIAAHVRFYESRRGGFTPSADYGAERFAQELLAIAREAEKRGFEIIRLRALFNAAAAYRIFVNDYEQAFSLYLETARGVRDLSLAQFPWKFHLYLEIADFYFSFREYADAARFYRLIAEDAQIAADNRRLYPALNGLGLCYRYAEQYERSDSCFRRILTLSAPVEEDRRVWDGIAGGNIGYNHCLRGDYKGALRWMEPALGKMERPNDDPFASQLAARIAAVHLSRGDLARGGKYLAAAQDYHRRSRLPEKSSLLLEVETRYRLLRGDRHGAAALLDSTLRARAREEEAFSGLVLRRVEQQLRAADRKVHEERLGAEKMRSRMYRQRAIFVTAALAVILLLLILVWVYYRRTRRAYHELVRRSQRWAGVEVDSRSDDAPPPGAEDEEAVPSDYGAQDYGAQDGGMRDCDTSNFGMQDDDASGEDASGEDASDDGVSSAAHAAASSAAHAAAHAQDGPAWDDDARSADDDSAQENGAKEPARPASFDRAIMHAVERAVVEERMFKQADLTLDMLSAATGYSRYYLSAALNRCTGVNFNAYVNEQRIKEAVRLMSDPGNSGLTVDAVAFDAGFNDRKNFYRVFKKVTGLSPTQFRRNLSA